MDIIYLAGNSLSNKVWIEQVKSACRPFASGEILYYDHWMSGKTFIDFDIEINRLATLVKDKQNYAIFSKSVGSILTLRAISESVVHPQKLIICGHPYLLAKEKNIPIDTYLTTLSIPTLFIQNEFDPLYSYQRLAETLTIFPPKNFQLKKIANNFTHDYDDFSSLTPACLNFLGSNLKK